jgi:hypothetical protein
MGVEVTAFIPKLSLFGKLFPLFSSAIVDSHFISLLSSVPARQQKPQQRPAPELEPNDTTPSSSFTFLSLSVPAQAQQPG